MGSNTHDLIIREDQLELLSGDLNGRAPWLHAISPLHLVRAALRRSQRLGEIIELARPLGDLGVELPDLDQMSPELVLSERQLALATRDLDGTAPWLDIVTPLHLVRAATLWSVPVAEVSDLARPLAELGVGLPDLDRIPLDLVLDERQRRLLSEDLSMHFSRRHAPGPAQIVLAANAWSMPIGQVVELARPLADLGLQMPDLDRIPADLVLDEKQMDMIRRGLVGAISPARLVEIAAGMRSHSLAEVVELAHPLAGIGVELSPLPPETEPWLQDREVIRSLWLLDIDIDWERQYLDPLPLAYRCVDSHKDPTDFRDALALLRALGFDVEHCIEYVEHCARHAASA